VSPLSLTVGLLYFKKFSNPPLNTYLEWDTDSLNCKDITYNIVDSGGTVIFDPECSITTQGTAPDDVPALTWSGDHSYSKTCYVKATAESGNFMIKGYPIVVCGLETMVPSSATVQLVTLSL